MKKVYILFLVCMISTSCNLKEALQKFQKINTELEGEFNHSEISSSYHFGTEENDNYFQIDFYNYNLADKTHSELEIKAKKVSWFFQEKHPEYDDLDFIEVRFTESDSENADSFVNFKFQ